MDFDVLPTRNELSIGLERALLDDELVLAQTPDVDYRSLPENPTPEEFYLMSRVKGEVTVGQLCAASGLGKQKAIGMIERLLSFGLLTAVNGDFAAPASEPPADDDDDLFGSAAGSNDDDLFGSSDDDLFGGSGEPDDDDLFGSSAPPSPATRSPGDTSMDNEEDFFAGAPIEEDEEDLFGALSQEPDLFGNDDIFGGDDPFTDEIDVGAPDGRLAAEPTEQYTYSFAESLLTDDDQGDDDDLFEAGSVAHKSMLGPRTPVVTRRTPAQNRSSASKTKPAASSASTAEREVKLKDRPTPYSPTDRPDYSAYPVPFDTWENPYLPEDSVHPDLQREVHYVYAHLEQLTYYHFFGLPLDADRKAIRASYFKYSKRFHPDLFFGQDVGELGLKAEAVFKYATKAYETLGKKNKRAEYDEALQSLIRSSQQNDVLESQKRAAAQTTLANRASTLASRGDFEKAASEIRRALALGPNRDLALQGANILLRANVRLDEAATYARSVLKQQPDDTAAMVMLGKIYEKNGLLNDARTMYERALGFAPDDASIRVHVERVKTLAG